MENARSSQTDPLRIDGVVAGATPGIIGLDWHHLPIRDVNVPGELFESAWEKSGPALLDMLRRGERVVVHCRGGLGRSGLVAAKMLVELGIAPRDAINRVRAARRGAIETAEQEQYVLRQAAGRLPAG